MAASSYFDLIEHSADEEKKHYKLYLDGEEYECNHSNHSNHNRKSESEDSEDSKDFNEYVMCKIKIDEQESKYFSKYLDLQSLQNPKKSNVLGILGILNSPCHIIDEEGNQIVIGSVVELINLDMAPFGAFGASDVFDMFNAPSVSKELKQKQIFRITSRREGDQSHQSDQSRQSNQLLLESNGEFAIPKVCYFKRIPTLRESLEKCSDLYLKQCGTLYAIRSKSSKLSQESLKFLDKYAAKLNCNDDILYISTQLHDAWQSCKLLL